MTDALRIPGWPKIFALGSQPTHGIFEGPVEITEKVDGSQFNFGVVGGELIMRSKGAGVHLNDGNKMFAKAAAMATERFEKGLLPEGFIFHGEYLQAPRHNTLAYDRTPKNHFALYGVTNKSAQKVVASYSALQEWAGLIDVDVVPLLFEGTAVQENFSEWIVGLTDRTSYLGGARVEGVVIKRYEPILIGGQLLPLTQAKYVTEAFKEKHGVEWKATNKGPLEKIADSLAARPRWEKAIQRAREAGTLDGSPKDIGPLLKSINQDMVEEEKEEIKELLWSLFWKDINRMAVRGFPEFYKQKLVSDSFW